MKSSTKLSDSAGRFGTWAGKSNRIWSQCF